MKIIEHRGYDLPEALDSVDKCFIDNLNEPIIRGNGDIFKSYLDCDWAYYGYNLVDTSRSIVNCVVETMQGNDRFSKWPGCDILKYLIVDLGFNFHHEDLASSIAFWTMFPVGTSVFLNKAYFKSSSFLKSCNGFARVINNPWFYANGTSEKTLVEIAKVKEYQFSIDIRKYVPNAEILSNEIANLVYGVEDRHKITKISAELIPVVSKTLSDYGF
ncbi:MAG: hypothetical protein II332_04270 [Kiritimatiellae bacterium]|nr:hypothetical protein [Kiritimatiellia bacterium]